MKRTYCVIYLTLFLLFATNCLHAQTYFTGDTLKKRNHQITTDFLAPMTGNFTLGLESYMGNEISLYIRLGLIGVGLHENYDKLQGFFVKVQPNFYITPNYKLENYSVQSNFQGTYFSPVIIVGNFSYNRNNYYNSGEYKITTGALLINLGHQFVYKNTFSFNIYGGLGYTAIYSSNGNGRYESYLFSHTTFDADVPIAFDGGFEIGFLFK